jgi:hypothetical protein
MDSEQDRRHLDSDGNQDEQPDGGRETLVPGGIRVRFRHFSGTAIGPGRRR